MGVGWAAADGPNSKPLTSPNQLPRTTEAAHRRVAVHASVGPHRIAYHLQLHRSTGGAGVPTRYGDAK